MGRKRASERDGRAGGAEISRVNGDYRRIMANEPTSERVSRSLAVRSFRRGAERTNGGSQRAMITDQKHVAIVQLSINVEEEEEEKRD